MANCCTNEINHSDGQAFTPDPTSGVGVPANRNKSAHVHVKPVTALP